MAVEDIATAHYRRQTALARQAALGVGDLWAAVDVNAIVASWAGLVDRATFILSAGQTAAAASSGAYVDAVANEYGLRANAAGRVRPVSFAGVASDGRPLPSLLAQPPITALRAIQGGASPAEALASGRLSLDMIVRTQVADAGRVADGVAIAARPQLTGYVRMVVGKTCSRCLILAGKRFRWNQGFQRHPRCDCRHIPVAEDIRGSGRTDPKAAFRAMSVAEQDRVFTRAGAQAIREGADMNQVVNARRGMTSAGTTTESTTRHGVARKGRLMPEAIYAQAGDDRDEAIRLLRQHAYIL